MYFTHIFCSLFVFLTLIPQAFPHGHPAEDSVEPYYERFSKTLQEFMQQAPSSDPMTVETLSLFEAVIRASVEAYMAEVEVACHKKCTTSDLQLMGQDQRQWLESVLSKVRNILIHMRKKLTLRNMKDSTIHVILSGMQKAAQEGAVFGTLYGVWEFIEHTLIPIPVPIFCALFPMVYYMTVKPIRNVLAIAQVNRGLHSPLAIHRRLLRALQDRKLSKAAKSRILSERVHHSFLKKLLSKGALRAHVFYKEKLRQQETIHSLDARSVPFLTIDEELNQFLASKKPLEEGYALILRYIDGFGLLLEFMQRAYEETEFSQQGFQQAKRMYVLNGAWQRWIELLGLSFRTTLLTPRSHNPKAFEYLLQQFKKMVDWNTEIQSRLEEFSAENAASFSAFVEQLYVKVKREGELQELYLEGMDSEALEELSHLFTGRNIGGWKTKVEKWIADIVLPLEKHHVVNDLRQWSDWLVKDFSNLEKFVHEPEELILEERRLLHEFQAFEQAFQELQESSEEEPKKRLERWVRQKIRQRSNAQLFCGFVLEGRAR